MSDSRFAEIRRQIENMYALSSAGKWQELKEQMTDDFCIIEAENLPYGGVYEGKDALENLVAKVFGFWQEPSLEIHDITVSEDNAVALLTLHVTSPHNGERLALKMAEVTHLREGKIRGMTPYYFDTAAIAKATGLIT